MTFVAIYAKISCASVLTCFHATRSNKFIDEPPIPWIIIIEYQGCSALLLMMAINRWTKNPLREDPLHILHSGTTIRAQIKFKPIKSCIRLINDESVAVCRFEQLKSHCYRFLWQYRGGWSIASWKSSSWSAATGRHLRKSFGCVKS